MDSMERSYSPFPSCFEYTIYIDYIFSMATLKNRRDFLKLYTPPPQENNDKKYRKLIIVILLSLSFVAAEIVAGVIADSISIISDAIHLVCDVLGYFSSFLFLHLSRMPPNRVMNFGYHRMQLLGALSNIFIVWTLILFVVFESTHRIINKEFVEKPLVMIIAATADLVVNIGIYKILHQGPSHSHGLLGSQCHHSHIHGEHHHHEEHHLSVHHHGIHGHRYEHHGHHHEHHQHHHHKNGTTTKQKQHEKSDGSTQVTLHHSPQELGTVDLTMSLISNESLSACESILSNNEDATRTNGSRSAAQSVKIIVNEQTSFRGQNTKEDQVYLYQKRTQVVEGGIEQTAEAEAKEQEKDSEANNDGIGMQAAVLHALSDMIMSIGLIISSLIIFFLGNPNGYLQDVTEWNPWHLCDPIATYIFSVTALVSTLPVINNSYHLLMNSAPQHLSVPSFQKQFQQIPGVLEVSHFHIWQLKPGKTLMTCHVVVKSGEKRSVLVRITDLARQKNIFHTAFQVYDEEDVESGMSQGEDDHVF